MLISTNPKPTIYRNLYENTGPAGPRLVVIRSQSPPSHLSHYKNEISQLTRHIEPMLAPCCTSLADGGPTSCQHWFNVFCLLGCTYVCRSLCHWWINFQFCPSIVFDQMLANRHLNLNIHTGSASWSRKEFEPMLVYCWTSVACYGYDFVIDRSTSYFAQAYVINQIEWPMSI